MPRAIKLNCHWGYESSWKSTVRLYDISVCQQTLSRSNATVDVLSGRRFGSRHFDLLPSNLQEDNGTAASDMYHS